MRMSVRSRRRWRMISWPAAKQMRCVKPSMATLSPSRTSESRHRVHGEIPLAGEQVVPLQDLMQDDSVHEAAESHPQQQARSSRRFRPR